MRAVRFAGTCGSVIDIDQLVNAINSVPPDRGRLEVITALREHFPNVMWTTTRGVLRAMVHPGYKV